MPQVIGVPKEVAAGEKRVATVPEVVEKLIKLGFKVMVESGAGDASNCDDESYRELRSEMPSGLRSCTFTRASVPPKRPRNFCSNPSRRRRSSSNDTEDESAATWSTPALMLSNVVRAHNDSGSNSVQSSASSPSRFWALPAWSFCDSISPPIESSRGLRSRSSRRRFNSASESATQAWYSKPSDT